MRVVNLKDVYFANILRIVTDSTELICYWAPSTYNEVLKAVNKRV